MCVCVCESLRWMAKTFILGEYLVFYILFTSLSRNLM